MSHSEHPSKGIFNKSTISELLPTILGNGLHSKTTGSISNAVVGLISSRDVTIHSMGRGLAEETGKCPKHTIKQIDRMLSNDNVPLISEGLVSFVIGQRKEICVALDWTEFDNDQHSTIALNLVTQHGRATPILWMTVNKNTLKGKRNSYEDQLLMRFQDILPKDIKVTLLADRGFFSCAFIQAIEQDFHWDYVVRIRGNILVEHNGEELYSRDLVKKGQSKLIKNAKITANGFQVTTLVVEWDDNMKEPWCLVSNKPTSRAKKNCSVLRKTLDYRANFSRCQGSKVRIGHEGNTY